MNRKTFIIALLGLVFGIVIGYLINFQSINKTVGVATKLPKLQYSRKEVFGFLPYWLTGKARDDYFGIITTLDYFGLTIDKDGTILKSTTSTELEPGYYALMAGSIDKFLNSAKAKNIKLSLTVFSGDQEVIKELIDDPIKHAQNLVNDVTQVMQKYGFSELNLDVEGIDVASSEAQVKFTQFVKEVRSQVDQKQLGSLSIDLIPVDFVRNDHLAAPATLEKYVDKIILMAYDFHSFGSFVTGPVAPLYGTETAAELDTNVTLEAAVKNYDSTKILLGVPFYGYSWETTGNFPRAATVPSSGLVKSSKEVEDLLSSCTNCVKGFDEVAQEAYVIYKNKEGTYQQIFYPDERSMKSKLDYIRGNNLGGVAIWALGYGGNEILSPVERYLKN